MHVTNNSASNSARVVGNAGREAHETKSDLAVPRAGHEYSRNLLLQSSIREASIRDLDNPKSECRLAMDVLVGHAAESGPAGHSARTALLDVYTQDIGPEKRQAILNAAQAISLRMRMALGEGVDNLSVTVAFMGACAPMPPLGENGPGHVDANLAHVARNLPPELQGKSGLLEENRAKTGAELLAAGANLENLNVWERPISMATPNVATQFVALGQQALRHVTLATVWVSGSSEHHVAVVAEPVASGIRFHVIARPGDELGAEVEKALKDLSFGGPFVVSRYEVEHPHLALEHLSANSDDYRGAGGVIREHADHWSSMSQEDKRAVTLASQAKMFESLAASGAPTPAADVSQRPGLEIVVKLPADTVVPKALQMPAATTAVANSPLAVQTAGKPQPTPAEFRMLASAAGFGKSWDGNPENVGFSGMTDVMETHAQVSVAARSPDPYLSRVLDTKLNNMPKAASDLAKAMMEVNRVQAKLAKSSIWEQSYVGQQKSPLGRGGANLLVLPHQGPLVLREPLAQVAKAAAAAKAAGNGPTAATARERAMVQFSRELANAKGYVESQLKRMDEGITLLKDIEASPKAGRTAKADAREMRGALEKLRSEWASGLPQQIVKFAAAAAVDPEQAVVAFT